MFEGTLTLTGNSNTILTLGILDGLRREFPFFLLKIAISRYSRQFEILCLSIVGSVRTVSQYPPNFSYVEVDKATGLDSLDSTNGNLD